MRTATGTTLKPVLARRLGIHAQSARQVGPLFEQFINIAKREGLDVSERRAATDAIQRCILLGFSDHVGRRLDVGTLRCRLVHGRRGLPGSRERGAGVRRCWW